MANAKEVLAACLDEAVSLATPSGRVSVDGQLYVPVEQVRSVLLLARAAFDAGDDAIADDRVRESSLSPSTLDALGVPRSD
ncbi:MAG: hypothetical protein QOE13_2748 [Gaiellaceae bacterium]|jgi:hypothetical protein|nr:hypothetical protein [Gaiellaceae bacterium]